MSRPITGQIAVTGTSQTISSTLGPVALLSIKAPLTNANPVFLGPPGVTLSTGYQLDPGDVWEYERRTQNGLASFEITAGDLAVVGTAGDSVSWLASP